MKHYKLSILPTGLGNPIFPKWTIQVKEVTDSGQYVKFAKQSPALIARLNEWLAEKEILI